MSARDVETAFALGYADGLHGRPLTIVDDALVDAYADGRRVGTARSGRLRNPRRPFFDTDFCRAVLARPVPPSPLDSTAVACGRGESGVSSHDGAP